MGSKRLPPDQENHLRLKNFFIREYLWNLSLTYMSYLSSNPHGRKPFFKPKMCLFGKIEILSKSCFS